MVKTRTAGAALAEMICFRGGRTTFAGQMEVHQHDIGVLGERHADGLIGGRSLTDYLDSIHSGQ